MDIHQFIDQMEDRSLPAPEEALASFEAGIGARLPEDYRAYLAACNGGSIGGRYWFDENVGVHCVGGLRDGSHFSLEWHRAIYQDDHPAHIPLELIWIMSDPFGNAICLGLRAEYRGKVFFWDHEQEPDLDEWDGSIETCDNICFLAGSFTEFLANLKEIDDLEEADTPGAIAWLAVARLPDGQSFVSDGSLLLDLDYAAVVVAPEKEIPAASVERLLAWNTTHAFSLEDLQPSDHIGYYMAPGDILLAEKYIEFLRRIAVQDILRLHGSGPVTPVLLYDGDKAIGALMPMVVYPGGNKP